MNRYMKADFPKVSMHMNGQPDAARFFFDYEVVDDQTFETRMQELKWGISEEFDLPFSDIVDRIILGSRSDDDQSGETEAQGLEAEDDEEMLDVPMDLGDDDDDDDMFD